MGSSKILLRILLGIDGIWPPAFTWGTKDKMFLDSSLFTTSVRSMFTFLVYDFMNI